MKLYLVRHGDTGMAAGTFVGKSDPPLAPVGRKQVSRLAPWLPAEPVCLCSPLLRCRETLALLQEQGIGRKARIDDRLREMDFGHWEMKTLTEIAPGAELIASLSEYHGFSFPGGESVAAFLGRLRDLVEELRPSPGGIGEDLILVSHGGVIRSLLCLLLNLDPRNYLLFGVDPASLAIVTLFPDGGVLTALNLKPVPLGESHGQ